jgi:hypothetical protein
MAKGDQNRYQNQLDRQAGLMNNNLGNLRGQMGDTHNAFMNNYNRGTDMNLGSYGDMMDMYKQFFNTQRPDGSQPGPIGVGNINPRMVSVNEEFVNPVRQALKGYGEFAETGGYSDKNIQDIRARNIAPTRSVFASAQNNLDRSRNLAGGYSPNYAAATARTSRDLANSISETNVNTNAALADAIRQGRLAGMGGLAQTGLGQQDRFLSADQGNQQADLSAQTNNAANALRSQMFNVENDPYSQGRNQQLAALAGMQGLYGTAPGLSNMFGQQVLGNQAQQLGLEGQQGQNGLGIIAAQHARSQIPSNFQQALGNIGGTFGVLGQLGGAMSGLGGLGNVLGRMGSGGSGGSAQSPGIYDNIFGGGMRTPPFNPNGGMGGYGGNTGISGIFGNNAQVQRPYRGLFG